MHDGMPYGRNQRQGQGHSREVDRQSPNFCICCLGHYSKTHYEKAATMCRVSQYKLYNPCRFLYTSLYYVLHFLEMSGNPSSGDPKLRAALSLQGSRYVTVGLLWLGIWIGSLNPDLRVRSLNLSLNPDLRVRVPKP